MTDTMLAKAARAHYERTTTIAAGLRRGHPFVAWDDLPAEQRFTALAGMSAALLAIRTPDKAMLKAALADADKQGWLSRREYYSDMETKCSWESMIDYILAEEPT